MGRGSRGPTLRGKTHATRRPCGTQPARSSPVPGGTCPGAWCRNGPGGLLARRESEPGAREGRTVRVQGTHTQLSRLLGVSALCGEHTYCHTALRPTKNVVFK